MKRSQRVNRFNWNCQLQAIPIYLIIKAEVLINLEVYFLVFNLNFNEMYAILYINDYNFLVVT